MISSYEIRIFFIIKSFVSRKVASLEKNLVSFNKSCNFIKFYAIRKILIIQLSFTLCHTKSLIEQKILFSHRIVLHI